MRLVEKPNFTPARCAVTGHTLGAADGPIIDTGKASPLIRPHGYVSLAGAIAVGRLVGMLDPDKAARLRAERDALAAEVEALRAEVIEAEIFKANVEYTLRQFGQTIHAKPGPKPKAA